jgi:uncharacterized membrane protein YjjP (DUF1212 family)
VGNRRAAMRRGLVLAIVVVFTALVLGQPSARAQTSPAAPSPGSDPFVGATDAPSPAVVESSSPDESAEPSPDDSPTAEPTADVDQDLDERGSPTPTPSSVDDTSGDDAGGIRPSVRRSGIPAGTIAFAVVVLAVVALGAFLTGRRTRSPASGRPPAGVTATGPDVDAAGAGPVTEVLPAREAASIPKAPSGSDASSEATSAQGDGAPLDRHVVAFLLELGAALIDAGDAVNRVGATLHSVARVQGLRGVGIIVLPTALIISVPGWGSVQTEVTTAGASRLRLDQAEAVLRLVDEARSGDLDPAEGRAELAAIRSSNAPVRRPLAIVGHAVAATGVALILRGTGLELVLAATLGAGAGTLQLLLAPRRSDLRPFLPLAASFLVATTVFLVARADPDLATVPPLVAPLIPFLPGALLTMGTLELATGQALSGVARLGSGGLQLVLLAGGIISAAQFVGIPAPTVAVAGATPAGWGGTVGVLAPWVGVGLFGLGITWAYAARRSSVPWILVVLFVAYAGQVLGGVFFGNALSAFFGAFAMTPVVVYAARRRFGPPSLVAFLPAFWLLVPGALGLEGVTRILGEGGIQGLATLATTGTAMIGIALGILLGLLVAAPDTWRLPTLAKYRDGPGA